ncbi:cell division protein FtsL [Paenibacillus darwinianus]|uniref:Cell division protein FtsL n=1 Tax=Paenibacillus darwinianus TaxID=1380763 RepID=A0A9W5S3W1_9BACL|nr:septum formation initiator family protein [Paenibacillus darwinianus]EXX91685.1 cell division protein FtsL [Paenibacillus darwinianus]EXX92544.1 cell division protein FtsL [Paenibacillus darwinianus]EXX92677.1 cell division protein FtsL [Paenibacillus darwinianus]
MAYMHGNLAVQPQKRQERQTSVQTKKKVVVRRKTLPVQEKLLYLFTVVMCVIVAGVIIFRYAQIYQMNLEIKQLTEKYEALSVQQKELQRKYETLSDPGMIKRKAEELGMIPNDQEVISVELGSGSSQTAMKE